MPLRVVPRITGLRGGELGFEFRSLRGRPCSDSSATPSFPSQPEGKIGCVWNPRVFADAPVHHREKPAGSTHSLTRGMKLPDKRGKKALEHFYICEFQCPGKFQDSVRLCGFVVMLPLEFRVRDRTAPFLVLCSLG